MLELINMTSQTVGTNGIINLGSSIIKDCKNRIILNNNSIEFNSAGKYSIHAIFNLENSGNTATNVTISIYNGTSQYGIPVTVTIPELVSTNNGYAEITIDKIINITTSSIGNTATINFIATSGAVISECLVDIYKLN